MRAGLLCLKVAIPRVAEKKPSTLAAARLAVTAAFHANYLPFQ